MLNNYPDVLSVKQVMEVLHVSKKSVYELLHNKEIKSKKVGRKYIIPKICVQNFLLSATNTQSTEQDNITQEK